MNSIDYLDREIRFYHEIFKDISHIDIMDNNFTFDLKRTKLISGLLKKYGYTFSCLSRVDIPKEIIDILAENNCTGIFFGVESLNRERLRELKKTINCAAYVRSAKEIICYALKRFNKKNINIAALYSPSNTKYNNELDMFFQRIDVTYHTAYIKPFPKHTGFCQESNRLIKNERAQSFFFSHLYDYLPWLVPESYYCTE
jgi:hypothetical protein